MDEIFSTWTSTPPSCEAQISACRRVKAETDSDGDSDGAVWTDSAPSYETAVSYETEKKKGQKRRRTEGSTHKDGKIRQTG